VSRHPHPRYDLIPQRALQLVAENLALSAEKHNHQPLDFDRPDVYREKLLRHLDRWQRGETWDADGFHALTAVIVRAMQLIESDLSVGNN
jgi:hypothetical protein